ncbi:MAG: HD domain-containing protein [Chloroflexi bacterium]|nr:HD domain-containing protein [Chloroflexota bacterium]
MLIHRLRQGTRALFAFSRPVDLESVGRYLSPPQLIAFQRLRRGEQLHSLNVLRAVLAQSDMTPPDLAVAALMHDVGKSRYPSRLWQKIITVAVRELAPPLFRRLSRQSPTYWWSRPFVVYVEHPAWSAEILAQTGASDAAIWLVAHHAEPADQWRSHDLYPLLQRLQSADDTN